VRVSVAAQAAVVVVGDDGDAEPWDGDEALAGSCRREPLGFTDDDRDLDLDLDLDFDRVIDFDLDRSRDLDLDWDRHLDRDFDLEDRASTLDRGRDFDRDFDLERDRDLERDSDFDRTRGEDIASWRIALLSASAWFVGDVVEAKVAWDQREFFELRAWLLCCC